MVNSETTTVMGSFSLATPSTVDPSLVKLALASKTDGNTPEIVTTGLSALYSGFATSKETTNSSPEAILLSNGAGHRYSLSSPALSSQ